MVRTSHFFDGSNVGTANSYTSPDSFAPSWHNLAEKPGAGPGARSVTTPDRAGVA